MQNRKRDIDVQNRLLDSVEEGEGGMFRENSIETCILSRVKQTTSPGWMHWTGTLGRPRGIGWRGRWEGGSGWGTHVYPCLIHVNVWQKPLQYCKVISLQLIKINGEKKWMENEKGSTMLKRILNLSFYIELKFPYLILPQCYMEDLLKYRC